MQDEEKQNQTQKIDQAILAIKQKMKLINFTNFEPPYLLHTLTKFRQTNLSRFLKQIKTLGENDEAVRQSLKTVHYIIQKFDDECFDLYSGQLIQPYIRKIFNDNYQFDNIEFKEVNTQYNLQAEIQQTLSQAAQWLTQIEITQDLLSRIQLYFKIKTPHIIQKIREDGLKNEKSTWGGAFMSGVKKLLSFGLRKGAKVVQTTFFTAVAPGAIMLTFAIIGGTASVPWKSSINVNNILTAAAIATVPFILQSMASTVQKSDYQVKLRRWAEVFQKLSDGIRAFNQKLQQIMRNVTLSGNLSQYRIQRTNLQKIMKDLSKNIENISKFDEGKYEQMRQRTEAYFRQYIQIVDNEWVLVLTKEQQQKLKKSYSQKQQNHKFLSTNDSKQQKKQKQELQKQQEEDKAEINNEQFTVL